MPTFPDYLGLPDMAEISWSLMSLVKKVKIFTVSTSCETL